MSREAHVPFCERLRVQLPRPTHRFNLSHRDIEGLLAERGITVSHESIRLWSIKLGPEFAKRLRGKHRGFGDPFHIDEVLPKLGGKHHYLWQGWSSMGMS